jgi:hypothetical protein
VSWESRFLSPEGMGCGTGKKNCAALVTNPRICICIFLPVFRIILIFSQNKENCCTGNKANYKNYEEIYYILISIENGGTTVILMDYKFPH